MTMQSGLGGIPGWQRSKRRWKRCRSADESRSDVYLTKVSVTCIISYPTSPPTCSSLSLAHDVCRLVLLLVACDKWHLHNEVSACRENSSQLILRWTQNLLIHSLRNCHSTIREINRINDREIELGHVGGMGPSWHDDWKGE